MRHRIRKKRSLKKVYCVFVEGKTEKWYLELAKRYEQKGKSRNNFKIKIEPKLQKKGNLKIQKENVYKYLKENNYDRIFWVLDFDTIRSEQKGTFEKIYKELKKNDSIIMLINNPCLEIWYLLHFKNTARQFLMCEEVIKEVKSSSKFFEGYEKSKKYYNFNDDSNNIYSILKPYQKDAINRAKSLDRKVEEDLKVMGVIKAFSINSMAQIYKIIELFVEEKNEER